MTAIIRGDEFSYFFAVLVWSVRSATVKKSLSKSERNHTSSVHYLKTEFKLTLQEKKP